MPRCNGLPRRLVAAFVVFAVSTAPCVFARGVAAADPAPIPARFTQLVTYEDWANVRPRRDHPDAEKSCALAQCATDRGGVNSKAGRLAAGNPDNAAGQ
jgi:hypothetical protein